MKILGLESSAKTASCAIVEDGRVLCLEYCNTGLTHSVTLLPMVQAALERCGFTPRDIDAYAVTCGPGSFTGIRIGVAAVKGLAAVNDTPCVGVSTLEAAAYPLRGLNCTAVAVMDARRSQVYTARFECTGGGITRLCEDNAIALQELTEPLNALKLPPVLIGDGAALCFDALKSSIPSLSIAAEPLTYQQAHSVALIAQDKLKNGQAVSCAELTPVYLRLPQAQRELNNKAASINK